MKTLFRISFLCLFVLLALFSHSCSSLPVSETDSIPIETETSEIVPVYKYTVIHAYPHDRNAFTQGLAFDDGFLYEGTGLYGHSTLRSLELTTGEILQVRELPSQFFGEGITIYKNKIIQLTWQSNLGFVYDKYSFDLLQTFNYSSEGWGITHDGQRLIMSDGTATLRYLDPDTLVEIGSIEVRDHNGPVDRLNELEYVNGEIYANVWQTEYIARISPDTGRVIGWVDLKGLLDSEDMSKQVDVLNGIAYDIKDDRLFVTGKFWPKIFEIVLTAPSN